MKLVTMRKPGGVTPGIVAERGIIDVVEAKTVLNDRLDFELPVSAPDFFLNAVNYLPALQKLLDMSVSETFLYKEEELEFGPAVPSPGKIICIGLNYRQHAIEAGLALSSTPVLFSKFQNAIAAHGDNIPLLDDASQYDYEAELVVVMGKTASRVSEADALDYVLGYCNGNDVSARDLQTRTSQWLLGKTLDKFMPIGPYLITADEVADPQNLQIRSWLNGELRQDSNTSDMVFSVRKIISYISQHFPLESGDIIATGTPEGVILGKENPQWMKPGDTVTVEVEGLGRLESRMVSA